MKFTVWIKTIFLSLFVLMLTSCSSAQENLWLKSPAWSRGGFIGSTSVLGPVSFVTDPDGNTYFFLVELNDETSNYSFDLARLTLDSNGLDHFRISPGELQSVKQPEIVRDKNGSLRLFWIASEGLYTLVVGDDGNPMGDPVLLSGDDVVSSYDIARAPNGMLTLWYAGSRRSPGIYALSDYDGSVQSALVDADGTLVRLRYDEQNQLHVLWVHYSLGFELTEIQYGIYDTALGEFAIPFSSIASLNLGITTTVDDLALGVDASNVYAYWSTSVHSGPLTGDIQANYQTFSIGENGQDGSPQEMFAPTIYSLEFDNSSANLKTGNRVSLSGLNVPMTSSAQDFRTNVDPTGEVLLAVRSPAEHLWRKTREQVNLLYFENGSLIAYQPLTFTSAVSTFPNVVNNLDGYVSLTWIERSSSGPFFVYFASTAPKVIDRFAALSTGEYLNIAYTVLFGMLIGALLAPITAGVWLIAPIIVIALFSFVRRWFSPRIGEYLSVVSVIIAIGTVWFAKLAIFPQMFEYVPFSAWIPNIPASLGGVLRIAIPVLILFISGFIAWHFTYRRENRSSLYFMMIYVGVDALITMSIYAVLYYGTYVQ